MSALLDVFRRLYCRYREWHARQDAIEAKKARRFFRTWNGEQ